MNYNSFYNKPTLNHKELIGDNKASDIGGMTEEDMQELLKTDLTPYYSKDEIDDLFARSFVYREKSGSIVTFDCPSTSQSIPEVTVGIEATQSGSGDPSPTNVRPISGWSAVNVYRHGKNFLNPNDTIYDNYTYRADGTTVENTYRIASRYYPCGSGEKFSFSRNDGATVQLISIVYFNDKKEFISLDYTNDKKVFTATTPSNTAFIRLCLSYGSGTATPSLWATQQLQLEQAEEPTEYEAYNGITYTTTLKDGQGNPMECYGGELVNENGVQTLVDGNDCFELYEGWNWVASTTYLGGFYINDTSTSHSLKPNTPVLCTHARNVNELTDYVNGTILHNTALNIRIMPETATVQDWKDYIVAQRTAGTPIKVCVQKAIPTEIPQDNLAIATQDGVNNLWADTGDIEVKCLDRIIPAGE